MGLRLLLPLAAILGIAALFLFGSLVFAGDGAAATMEPSAEAVGLTAAPAVQGQNPNTDPNNLPFGADSTNFHLSGGPDHHTFQPTGSAAWKWTFKIEPPLGSGVTANTASAKIYCDGTWKDLGSGCILLATASGGFGQVIIRKDASCPCTPCTTCSKLNVQWEDTSTTPHPKIAVYTVSWPAKPKSARAEFESAELPRAQTIAAVSVVGETGEIDTEYFGDLILTIHALGASTPLFTNGATSITVPVARGSGAVRVDLTNTLVNDVIWIDATGPSLNTTRRSVGIY